jgi:hypothetical protein
MINNINRSESTGKDLIGGCFYCYIYPKLIKNCINHSWAHPNLKDTRKRPRPEEKEETTSDSSESEDANSSDEYNKEN